MSTKTKTKTEAIDETPAAAGAEERVIRGDLDDPVTHREYSEEQHAAVDAGLPLDPTVKPLSSHDA